MNKNIEIYVTGESDKKFFNDFNDNFVKYQNNIEFNKISDIKYIKENENGSVKWISKKIYFFKNKILLYL